MLGFQLIKFHRLHYLRTMPVVEEVIQRGGSDVADVGSDGGRRNHGEMADDFDMRSIRALMRNRY